MLFRSKKSRNVADNTSEEGEGGGNTPVPSPFYIFLFLGLLLWSQKLRAEGSKPDRLAHPAVFATRHSWGVFSPTPCVIVAQKMCRVHGDDATPSCRLVVVSFFCLLSKYNLDRFHPS